MGYPTLSRPEGRLIWFHGASVGESLSLLTPIRHLGDRLPDASFLVTSGTATSARILADRLPARAQHQFAPLDIPGAVDRFYDHWRPDAAIFVESELWPTMLIHGRKMGVPLALLNARLSEKSVQGWKRWPDTARQVLNGFSIMLTQNRAAAENLIAMGADPARVQIGINLKATSDPLPVDENARDAFLRAVAERPLWVASSTHPGEEKIVLAAHKRLLSQHKDLCLILIPRHPERGDSIAAEIAKTDLSSARRSTGDPPNAQTEVYLADTLGETGTWYSLSRIVFLGGALEPMGGHNPFEPAQAGAAVLTGPHMANFSETYEPMIALGAARVVRSAEELSSTVDLWLTQPDRLADATHAAQRFTENRAAALDEVVDTLLDTLDLRDAT